MNRTAFLTIPVLAAVALGAAVPSARAQGASTFGSPGVPMTRVPMTPAQQATEDAKYGSPGVPMSPPRAVATAAAVPAPAPIPAPTPVVGERARTQVRNCLGALQAQGPAAAVPHAEQAETALLNARAAGSPGLDQPLERVRQARMALERANAEVAREHLQAVLAQG